MYSLSKFRKKVGIVISVLIFILSFSFSVKSQVTYSLNTPSYYTVFSDGGGVFDNTTELGLWANSGNKHVVAWREMQTNGTNSGSARYLQVGDVLTVTIAATAAYGQIGLSLNSSPSTGSWANRYSNSRLYIQVDGTTGSWYVNSNAGNETLDYTVSTTWHDYVFNIRITSETTADIELVVDGTTTKRLMNVTMNGSSGTDISHFVVYLNDDWNGSANTNIYLKPTTQHNATGEVYLGYYLSSGTYTPGLVKDGLTSNSTSTSNSNDVYIGGDLGSTVVLSSANTYTGATTINANAALKLGVSSATSSSGPLGTTDAGTTVSSGGVLDMNGYSLSSSATESLTLNGTGISSSGALINSSGTSSVWAGSIALSSLSAIGGTGDITISGVISGANDLEKLGSGKLTLSGNNTYTGATKIYAGTLELGAADRISNSSNIRLIGGTLSTGSSTGYNETVGTLQLEENSIINLCTGSHSLNFSASNGVSWTSGKTLTITGWSGGSGSSGTAGRIFVGSDASGLTAEQLSQITFAGIGEAKILSTGEIVPKGIFQSKTTGNWNVAATWEVYNGSGYTTTTIYPTKDESTVTIKNTHVVTLTSDATVSNLIIESGGELALSDKSLTLARDATLTNNSTFTAGTGTVVFEGVGTVAGSQVTTFYNVIINGTAESGGVNFGAYKSKIDGTLTINSWGYADVNAQTYGVNSHLVYNTGAVYDRRVEWGASGTGTIGVTPGYPNDVTITGNTTLNYVHETIGIAKSIYGDLVIDAGSSLYMDYGSPSPGITDPLTVNGNVTINGNLSLSNDVGGDIIVKGNWTRGAGSTLVNNERAVFFTGTSEQVINTAGGETFDYVVLDNSSNLDLQSNVRVEEQLEMVSGNITTNSNILEIGTSVAEPGLLDYTSGMVFGNFKRWFIASTNSGDNTGLFPLGVGTDFRPVLIEYTSAPSSGGSLTAQFVETEMGWQNSGNSPTITAVGSCGQFSVTNYSDEGYWQVDAADGLSGGNYNISIYPNGFEIINDYCQLTALKRVGAGNWVESGTHKEPNQTGPYGLLVKRTGATGWSNWGLAGGKNNVLPVELVSFYAICEGNFIDLFWETASEKNSDYFDVERSSDGVIWMKVGELKSAGNSKKQLEYSFRDISKDENVYYRLKQVDFDGKSEFSEIIAVKCFEHSSFEIKVYPNPVKDILFINTNIDEPRNSYLYLRNISGQLIYEISDLKKGELFIDVSDFKPGLYFLQINNGQSSRTIKVSVE